MILIIQLLIGIHGTYALQCLSCSIANAGTRCDTLDRANYVDCPSECYKINLINGNTQERSVAYGCNVETDKALREMNYVDYSTDQGGKMSPPTIERLIDDFRAAAKRPVQLDGVPYQMRVRFCRSAHRKRNGQCEPIVYCKPPYCKDMIDDDKTVVENSPEGVGVESSNPVIIADLQVQPAESIANGDSASQTQQQSSLPKDPVAIDDDSDDFDWDDDPTPSFEDGSDKSMDDASFDANAGSHTVTTNILEAGESVSQNTVHTADSPTHSSECFGPIELVKGGRPCSVQRTGNETQVDVEPDGDLVWHAWTCKSGEVLGVIPPSEKLGCDYYGHDGVDEEPFRTEHRTGLVYIRGQCQKLTKGLCYHFTASCHWNVEWKPMRKVIVVAQCTGERPKHLPKLPKLNSSWTDDLLDFSTLF